MSHSTIRTRSLRLDEENYEWLTKLPGGSLNDSVTQLRKAEADKLDTMADQVAEILELVRSQLAAPITILPAGGTFDPVVDNRPKNAYCKHCGSRFAGAKYATICPSCKSDGHTLIPAECPKCGEGRGI